MAFYEKTLHTTSIYQGKIISVEVAQVEPPNGKRAVRELVRHSGAVAVIPFTEEGQMVLVRQFRKPLDKEIFEIPAGKLEKGEDPLSTARRELREETGYEAERMRFITSFYTSPGFADELLYIYEAEGLRPGRKETDEDEFVETCHITLEEGLEMMANQKIHDAKTAFALLYWQNKLISKKQGS